MDTPIKRLEPTEVTGDRCDGDDFRCSKLYCERSTFSYYCSKHKRKLKLDTAKLRIPAIRLEVCRLEAARNGEVK